MENYTAMIENVKTGKNEERGQRTLKYLCPKTLMTANMIGSDMSEDKRDKRK